MSNILVDVFLSRNLAGSCIWKPNSSGYFSSKPFYKELDLVEEVQSPRASIWMGFIPPKVGAFCWLAVVGKISTIDMLRRREIVMNHVPEVVFARGWWNQ